MPYIIRKEDAKYVVRKKETSEKVGTHDTKRQARAQVKAIYMHEHRPWTHSWSS